MEINKVEQIINEINSAFKKGGIYPENHPVRQKLSEGLKQKLNSILQEKIILSIVQNKIVYQEKVVGKDNPIIKQFASNLHQKGIATLGLTKGITAQEIKLLFDILMLKNEVVRQQDIGKILKDKGLVHITGSKLHYKEVSPTEEKESDLEKKSEDKEYSKILGLMENPEEISKHFVEIAQKDIDINLKAEFVIQGIEEISRLLLGKSPAQRERINAGISQGVRELSPLLASRVLNTKREKSLQKGENIEDYISSIATVVGDFGQGLKLSGDDFSQESIYPLGESDNIVFELLPYSYKQEYKEAVTYFQEKISEILKKKKYFQCNRILRLFIEDGKKRERGEKEKLFAALRGIISSERVEELLKDLSRIDKGTDEERVILDILGYWQTKDFLSLVRDMIEEKKNLEMFPELIIFLLSQKEDLSFSSLISLIKQTDLELQKDIIFLTKGVAGEGIDAFLIAEIENEDEELSENALTALGRRRCFSAVPTLISLLNPEKLFFKNVDWEKKIIESLVAICDERAVPKLKRMLEKRWFFLRNKKVLREAAIDALKKIGSEEAIKALLETSALGRWIRYGR